MKTLKVVVIVILLFYSTLQAQNKKIGYLTPENVIAKLIGYQQKNTLPKHYFYYGIWHTQNDTSSILLCYYHKSDKLVRDLIKKSGRFILLKKDGQVLPIVIQSDLLFSNKLHFITYEKGKEGMEDITISPSGYLVVFTGPYYDTHIVKSGYYQN